MDPNSILELKLENAQYTRSNQQTYLVSVHFTSWDISYETITIMADYSKFKVVELKELVKERGINSNGLKLKQHFIDALVEDDAQADDAKVDEVDEDDAPNQDIGEDDAKATEDDAPKEDTPEEKTQSPAPEESVSPQDANKADEPESSDSDSRKRKRRSRTPPVAAEVVSKKLKTVEDDPVVLPEDMVVEDAPVPVVDSAEETEKVIPYGSSDDVMREDVIEQSQSTSETLHAQPSSQGLDESTAPSRTTATKTEESQDTEMKDTEIMVASPAKYPATRALYIRELVRPLQPGVLCEHLISIAHPTDSPPDPGVVVAFHLDKLRTHALVLFDSLSAASRVRSKLHDQIWPSEPMRKPLWVDFVPEDKVQEWIDLELARADMTRWEVVYTEPTPGSNNEVMAELREAGSNLPTNQRKPSGDMTMAQPRFEGAGGGMPNAPSGPRRPSSHMQPAPRSAEAPKQNQSKSFDSLDQRYSFTETKPKLYFQPVARELVDKRLGEFEKETSRDWDEREADPAAYAEGELRRYTFEDDKIVDGGADFGLFGKPPRSGPPPRRGGGGGRGAGGGRGGGGGGRPPGDRYLGSGLRR